jgi:hypothetical protein
MERLLLNSFQMVNVDEESNMQQEGLEEEKRARMIFEIIISVLELMLKFLPLSVTFRRKIRKKN